VKYTSDLFISYATEDFDSHVRTLFMALFEIGLTSSWIDKLVIKPGDSIPQRIDEGLRTARYLLPIVTEYYFRKMWTRRELDAVRMMSKPTIPIWIEVGPAQVKKFSPLLAAQKAIIWNGDPYLVAQQVADTIITNRRTHFYKSSAQRKESELFWKAIWVVILEVIQGIDRAQSSFLKSLADNAPDTGVSPQEHFGGAITRSDEMIRREAMFLRKVGQDRGEQVSDEEIAHLICAQEKRENSAWFPYEPMEHAALRKLGLDRF
jgi:hypothetical protein